VSFPHLDIQPSLRTATNDDIEAILRHRREMFREMGGRYARTLEQFEEASRRYFEEGLRSGRYRGIFVEKSDHIVAGGGLLIADWPGSPLNFEPRRAWILNIFVEPQHRREGLARMVIEDLLRWCRENGFRSVALHASENGRNLYEKLGFRSTNEMNLLL
jgi:GNAT superfamily N-acetyltransferase